jgi:uncharacterized repeat protein (TIGR03803 family)
LVRDAAGNLYGTTDSGGDFACGSGFGCGVVFKLDMTGRETVLHKSTGGKDGAFPAGRLVRDNAGNLYGTPNPLVLFATGWSSSSPLDYVATETTTTNRTKSELFPHTVTESAVEIHGEQLFAHACSSATPMSCFASPSPL